MTGRTTIAGPSGRFGPPAGPLRAGDGGPRIAPRIFSGPIGPLRPADPSIRCAGGPSAGDPRRRRRPAGRSPRPAPGRPGPGIDRGEARRDPPRKTASATPRMHCFCKRCPIKGVNSKDHGTPPTDSASPHRRRRLPARTRLIFPDRKSRRIRSSRPVSPCVSGVAVGMLFGSPGLMRRATTPRPARRDDVNAPVGSGSRPRRSVRRSSGTPH